MNCHKRIFTLIILVTVITWGGMAGLSLAVDNRGHGAPADALPKELKNVSVKDYFLPGKTKEAGVIQTAVGHVVVAHGDLRQAYFAANGDKLYEQDIVFTLKASKCRIKLLNNDIITLGDRTRITVKEVSGTKDSSEKKTNLSVAQGKAMFYAIRLLNQKSTTMTVESPTAVAGVRGTKFGMEVTIEGENSTAALPLLLADASVDWGRHLILAQANPPPVITTAVHGFDGTVAVTSTMDGRTQSVGAGQTVSASALGVGAPTPTPPQVSQSFQAATNVPPPGGGGGGGSQGGGSGSGTGSGNAPDAKATSDTPGMTTITVDTSSITQQQNVNQEEQKEEKKQETKAKDPVSDPKTNASSGSHRYGYFTAFLTNITNGTLVGEFVSSYRYGGDSNLWARGPNDADYVRALGNSGADGATVKWVVFDSGSKNSGELNLIVSSTNLGNNDNMDWGYATVAGNFTISGNTYAFNNRSYYIFGENMPSMVNLSGSATYSGAAYGTYWSAAGGSNMTGTFKTDVNLTSAALSNFNLDVSGNGASAYIHNGYGSIASDATFYLSSGTWNLNGITPDQTTAKGSLYGSDGAGMGGVWGMYSTAYNTSATGIFAGTNQQKGHYAGMLEYVSEGQHYYSGTYMTTSAQDFSSASAKALKSSSSDYTNINGTSSPKNMTALMVSGSTWAGSKPVTFSRLDANEYMEWGTWTQTTAMNISGCDYFFNDKGAYVWGSPTTADEMATLKSNAITGNYSGPAWGTLFAAGGNGTSLTGNFNGSVNFASQTITNFKIDVSPTGAGTATPTVYISGASGSFSNGTSTFAITTGQGETWNIKGSPATTKGASGTVYGNGTDKGKYVGGVWQAGYLNDKAVGGFQGKK